jgi:LysR family hydrogen peroxide-inducible transcriptional activator
MPSLTQLEYLVAVDQHRHFGKAANACNISQPTLSMQLQKLEDEYGITLFDRSKQPVVPTPEGIPVIEQAKIVLREVGKLGYLAKNESREPSGEFKLGLIPTLAPYLLPLFLGSFAETYPKVRLIIEEMTTENIILALGQDRLDAGLLATPLGVSSLREKPLFYEPFYLYVSPSHPLYKAKSSIKEEDLDGKDVWLLNEGHCLRDQVLRVCSLKSGPGVFTNVQFESGNLETLIHLVTHGHGYTFLPYLAMQTLRDPTRKRLIRSFSAPAPSREISLVYHRDQYKQAVLSALSEEILRHLPKELPLQKTKKIDVIPI